MKKVIWIVITLLLAVSTAHAAPWFQKEKPKPPAVETEEASEPQAKIVPRFQAPESFNELVESVSSAVVNISTTKNVKVQPFNPFGDFGRRRGGPGDPFDDFFEKFFEGAPQQRRNQQSLGSGFIFDANGHILTNNHVVANADEITVTLSDERKFKAKVIGRDEETDIAVIKIEVPKDLPFEDLGDSDSLKIGDWVIAIGNPFGLSQTVTAGIVSAKGRLIGAGPYDNFIQTDASINPGNSGGPLFNMKGNVVGINTAIYAGGQGLGFAIPVNMAKKLVPQLIKHGKVLDRGWLGVMIQPITPELAKSFGLSEDQKGALIGDVVSESPAAKAGIKRGDVIIKFDGNVITKSQELPGRVAVLQPGQNVVLTVLRDGKETNITVVLGKREGNVASSTLEGDSGVVDKLGLVVRKLTASEAHELKMDPEKGVYVERVEPGSSAENADVRAGDVLYEINGTAVNSLAEYKAAVEKLEKGKIVRLLIRRDRGTVYLAFTLN